MAKILIEDYLKREVARSPSFYIQPYRVKLLGSAFSNYRNQINNTGKRCHLPKSETLKLIM